ncbi:sodium:proton antiporter [Stella sp.]|uniref:sodium:proton antiporter n=1 Tax=Stella sp. TaxID=2912054 RepID=UPI0035B04F19
METLFAVAVGTVVAASVYLFLSRDLLRGLLGFILFGTAVNLAILLAGRVGPIRPPLVDGEVLGPGAANPLPQALILTAIVIGFGLAAFALMLTMRAHREFGTTSAEDLAEAETAPPASAPPAPAERREAA